MKTKLILTSVFILLVFTVVSQNLQKLVSATQNKYGSPSPDPHFILSPTDPLYDSIYESETDSLNKWEPKRKDVDRHYNSNKDIVNHTLKVFDNGAWNNSFNYAYTYDASYNETNFVSSSWTGTNWVNFVQITSTYTAGKKDTTIQYQWNTTANAWDNVGKILHTYDSNGNLLTEEFQPWDGTHWTPLKRLLYSYDADKKVKETFMQFYENLSWVDFYRIQYKYDAQGNNTLVLFTEMDENKNWINYEKAESTFDSSNNLSLEKYFQWNSSDSVWNEYKKFDYNWDLNKNLLAYKREDFIKGTYVLVQTYKAAYNTLNQLTDKTYLSWENAGTSIESGDSTHYFIHDIPGSVNDLKSNKNLISIYPNPSNGLFTVTLESKRPIKTLEVYNIVGERIFQQYSSNQVNLSNTPSGIYFVRVDDGTGIYTRKIAIQ